MWLILIYSVFGRQGLTGRTAFKSDLTYFIPGFLLLEPHLSHTSRECAYVHQKAVFLFFCVGFTGYIVHFVCTCEQLLSTCNSAGASE